MSYIGILEYVIGIVHDKDIWYYVGEKDSNGKKLRANERYSSFLVDSKRYDDMDVLRWELEKLPKTLTYKILEIQRCPKCKKETLIDVKQKHIVIVTEPDAKTQSR